MNRRGYTLIELILAVSAASLLLVGLVGLFGRVMEMSRETTREQIWLADDLAATNTLDYMARLLDKSQPSSMASEQLTSAGNISTASTTFTPDRIRFKILPTTSDGAQYQKDWSIIWGNIGYNETGYEFRYNGAGYVEEIVNWWSGIIFPTSGSSTNRLTFANRPGVTIDTASHGTSWHFIKYATEWLTNGESFDSIPRSGWSNDGFTLPNGASQVGNWYAGVSGVRLQIRLNFPDRPSKTYTRYVSLPKPGVNRLYDRWFDNKYLAGAAGLNYDSAIGSRLYLAGGWYPGYGWVGDVDRYNVAANSWSSDVHTLPSHYLGMLQWENRRGHVGGAAYGNKVFFAGGITPRIQYQCVRWFDILDVSTGAWTHSDNLSTGRDWPGVATDGSYVYIVGGRNGNRTMDRYTISTGAWATFSYAGCCSAVGQGPSVAVAGGHVYIFGGTSADRQVIKFDTSTLTFSSYATLPYDHNKGMAVTAWGGWGPEAIFLLGNQNEHQRVMVFDPNTDAQWWLLLCCWFLVPQQPPISIVKFHRDDEWGEAAGDVVDSRYGRLVYVLNGYANYKTYGIDLVPPYF